jgi:hypothetical protein
VPGPHRPAPARAAWFVAVAAVLAVSAGCGGHDRPAREPEQAGHPTAPVGVRGPDACPGHIDDLIAADIVPRADRDYAIGMCEARRPHR